MQQLLILAASWKNNGKWLAPDSHLTIMGAHGKRWHALSPAAKLSFEAMADTRKEQRRREIAAATAETQAKLKLHKERVEQEKAAGGKALRISTCRFPSEDTQAFDAFCQMPDFTSKKVAALRSEALAAVQAPPLATQAALEACLQEEPRPANQRLLWLASVCKHRAHFAQTIFRVPTLDGDRFLMFVFASQSPYMVCFNDVLPITVYRDCEPVIGSSWEAICLRNWEFEFQIQFMSFCFDEALDVTEHGAIQVLGGHRVSRG